MVTGEKNKNKKKTRRTEYLNNYEASSKVSRLLSGSKGHWEGAVLSLQLGKVP